VILPVSGFVLVPNGGTVLDRSVRGLCAKAYPGHPKGCPNLGRRATCPPQAPLFELTYDLSEVWAIWNVFDFGAHVSRMRALHPTWSQRQVECCRYWQNGARKSLDREIHNFFVAYQTEPLGPNPLPAVTRCPEAMGVDITKTMYALGVRLEWPPKNYAVQVALAARRNK
jgi:predicted metal-binding protein